MDVACHDGADTAQSLHPHGSELIDGGAIRQTTGVVPAPATHQTGGLEREAELARTDGDDVGDARVPRRATRVRRVVAQASIVVPAPAPDCAIVQEREAIRITGID